MTQTFLLVLIGIHLLFLCFHLAVLCRLIPYNVVWGGRLTSIPQMVRFELVSILVTLLFTALLAIRAELWEVSLPGAVLQVGMWSMAGIYLLNTLGNAASKNKFEKWIFGSLTFIMFVLLVAVIIKG